MCFIAPRVIFENTTTFWIMIEIHSFIASYIADNDIDEYVKG